MTCYITGLPASRRVNRFYLSQTGHATKKNLGCRTTGFAPRRSPHRPDPLSFVVFVIVQQAALVCGCVSCADSSYSLLKSNSRSHPVTSDATTEASPG